MKVMSHDKIVDLPSVSTCHAKSFGRLRHIHLSLQKSTAYPNMTLKSCSLSYFEHSSNQYIHSEGIL